MKIKLEHARALGYCTRGVRVFGKKHKLDLTDFLKNGIDEEILAKLNDDMSNKMIEVAKNGQ